MRGFGLLLIALCSCSRPNGFCSECEPGSTTSGGSSGGSSSSSTGSTTSSGGSTTSSGGSTTSSGGSTTSSGGSTTSSGGSTTSSGGSTTSSGGSTTSSGGSTTSSGGSGATGTLCSAASICIAGDECLDVHYGDGTLAANLCLQNCVKDADCTQATAPGGIISHCSASFSLASAGLCTVSCNPLDAADGTHGCPAGLSCGYATASLIVASIEISDCIGYGSGGDGAACGSNSDCRPGFACVSVNQAASTCQKVCASGGPCPAGKSCSPPSNVLLPQFGFCI